MAINVFLKLSLLLHIQKPVILARNQKSGESTLCDTSRISVQYDQCSVISGSDCGHKSRTGSKNVTFEIQNAVLGANTQGCYYAAPRTCMRLQNTVAIVSCVA
jgi:hypothetical protein